MFLNKNKGLPNKNKGFTLIEVLVAIAIFASLSIGAYQVVNQIQRSNELSQQRTDRLSELQRALVIMDGDFRQMALRQSRTDGEQTSEKLILWQDHLLDSDEKGLIFSRVGWQNPQQQFPRGEVTKVGYRLKDHILERIWWHYPDTPVGQQGITMPLLTGVENMDVKFYNHGEWLSQWTVPLSLPQALLVKFNLKDYGEIERIYLTPVGTLTIESNNRAISSNSNDSNTNNSEQSENEQDQNTNNEVKE